MSKMKVLVLASLVAFVAFTGCQNPINPGQGGTLTVSMNDAVSRSILPGISMNPVSYDLAGTGPNGASFIQSVSSGSSVTMTGLAFGNWTVTVTAKNATGTPIGQGSGTVTVLSNASVSLSITVRPYDGFGTLALNVSWPAAQVQTAQIQSALTPASGAARPLAFAVNGSAGTASFSASDVATGYHTLVLKLLDNGHLAIGAVEVVRIVKDQTSSGTLAFTNVNQATGTLNVNLEADMSNPLVVSITGGAATKPANQSLALSAAVSNYSDNVTYVWYVNGDAKATGASFNFDDTWALGYYRIDVTAFSADGKRAGSATQVIRISDLSETKILDIAQEIGFYPGSGYGYNGLVFEIQAKEKINLRTFVMPMRSLNNTPVNVNLWYKTGTWQGYTQDPNAWHYLGFATVSSSAAWGVTSLENTPLDYLNINIPAGERISIRIDMSTTGASHLIPAGIGGIFYGLTDAIEYVSDGNILVREASSIGASQTNGVFQPTNLLSGGYTAFRFVGKILYSIAP